MTTRENIVFILQTIAFIIVFTVLIGYPFARVEYNISISSNCRYYTTDGCLSECNCLWCHTDTSSLCTKSINYNNCKGMNITKSPQCTPYDAGYTILYTMLIMEAIIFAVFAIILIIDYTVAEPRL